MRYVTVAVVALVITVLACTASEDRLPITDLSTAPFHTSLADAMVAAASQNIVIDFYVDW